MRTISWYSFVPDSARGKAWGFCTGGHSRRFETEPGKPRNAPRQSKINDHAPLADLAGPCLSLPIKAGNLIRIVSRPLSACHSPRLMSQHEPVYRPEHTRLAKKNRFGPTVERH